MEHFHYYNFDSFFFFSSTMEILLLSSLVQQIFSGHWITLLVYHPLLTSTGYLHRLAGDGYGKPFLIPTPEVKVIPRAKDDDCLIIASDGLWDVISNAEACRVARLQILQWHRKNNGVCSDGGGVPTISHPAAQAAADYLVKLALMKGSADNITVTVIDLKLRKKTNDKSICFL